MEALIRFFYAIPCAIRHKFYLINIYSNFSIDSITDLKIEYLIEKKIEALVLDFDGVLSPHGYDRPLSEVLTWLDYITKYKSRPEIFILSNNPSLVRFNYFKDNYPKIKFFVSKKKKPYPEGLQKICQENFLDPEKVIIVDDRLMTGVLAAANAGTKALFIRKPFRDFHSRPVKETFFSLLRFLDRAFLA